MKAVQTSNNPDNPITLNDVEPPKNEKGYCIVKVKAAGLNRRDQWIREGKYPGIRSGITLGSDACGVVEEGEESWVRKDVIINPNVSWGDNPDVQSLDYSILGMPTDGTLGEYIKVPVDRLVPKPDHLSYAEAAALPLAGMTAYRACFTKANLTEDSTVLVTGAGGGVSQMVIAFLKAIDCSVLVTSGSDKKIDRCLELGVKAGVNYHQEDWEKILAKDLGPIDAVIDSAGGASLNKYLKAIKPGGKIIIYGSTTGKVHELDVFRLFWSQVSIEGSTMANDLEFNQMVDFVNSYQVRPIIDKVFVKEDYIDAFDRFDHPDHFGKIIVGF